MQGLVAWQSPRGRSRARGPVAARPGRFGKALEQLAEVCDSDESLLSTCVTLNPQFRHTSRSIEGGLQIAERKKKEFTLRTQDTSEIRFRGAAKQEDPGFLDAVEANAR